MPIFPRKPELPATDHDDWWAFLDCAQRIEGGRRVLLGTLPTGRVEPAPVAVGVEALRRALDDVAGWMATWRRPELDGVWQDCEAALRESRRQLDTLVEVAARTGELEQLLEAVTDVVAPLDAFADAEREWRRHWRCPQRRADATAG